MGQGLWDLLNSPTCIPYPVIFFPEIHESGKHRLLDPRKKPVNCWGRREMFGLKSEDYMEVNQVKSEGASGSDIGNSGL